MSLGIRMCFMGAYYVVVAYFCVTWPDFTLGIYFVRNIKILHAVNQILSNKSTQFCQPQISSACCNIRVWDYVRMGSIHLCANNIARATNLPAKHSDHSIIDPPRIAVSNMQYRANRLQTTFGAN